jgi:L-ascorbate metabolism protein UlaG (beta-lactamase superfamily)
VYFAGDTDLFDAMTELSAIDVALLPIGGWGESLGPGHLDPQRAARATELILPRLVVPVHWGTYSPIGVRRRPPTWLRRPAEQFAAAMDGAGHGSRLRLLEPGERLDIDTASTLPSRPA